MSNIIDSIQLSGVTYTIQGSGGGGVPESTFTAYTASTDSRIGEDEEVTAAGLNALNDKITPTVELTQAQYDALATKDPNTYYIITDAQAGDLTNYYTKTETNTLLGGKADTATTYTKTEVDTALGGKQATLVSGTNIKTINNESILGSGNIDIQGGSTYTAGRGIDITNDTISFSLPISAGTGSNSVIEGDYANKATGSYSHAEGGTTSATTNYAHAEGMKTKAAGQSSHAEGERTTATTHYSHTEGYFTIANNKSEHASGQYNVSNKIDTTFGHSGNTLFSVGNGTDTTARHNAFEIRQNGDIYITSGNTDIKLQDHLGGGGGGGIDSGTVQTMIDQSISGKTNQSDFVSHSGNTSIHVTTAQTAAWDAKSDFSGSYNDLTDKPTIPIVPTNVSSFNNDAGYITSNDISGKTNQSDFVSHSGNTTMHVTESEKSTWNAKSDFSGNYNDLSNKPTIPTSASQLTNDSGYITSSALNGYATEDYVTAATNDMATKTWVGQQGYLTQHQDISGKQDVSGMTAYTETSAFTAHTADTTVHVTAQDKTNWNNKSDFSGSYNDLTNKLSAGTNITIVDNVISAEGGGGGKAVAAGTNISVTTGETADTINCTLPITANSSVFNTISVGQGSGGGSYNTLIGANARCDNNSGHNVFVIAKNGGNSATGSWVNGTQNVIIGCIKDGYLNFNMQSFNTSRSVVIGGGGISTDKDDSVAIGYLANVSGTTKTNINNQLKINTSNQVYISNSANTSTYCLQEKIENTETALGGLKLVKLSQSAYDALSPNYDSNTLYVIVN